MCKSYKYNAVTQITELLPDFLQFIITSSPCLSILFILERVVVYISIWQGRFCISLCTVRDQHVRPEETKR